MQHVSKTKVKCEYYQEKSKSKHRVICDKNSGNISENLNKIVSKLEVKC